VKRVRVFYVVNTDPLISVGPGSYIAHILEIAGGENILGKAQAPYPRVPIEEVLRQDPEVLVFPVGIEEGIPESEQQLWRRWSNLSAVVHNRLYQVKGDLVNRPGPRVIEGVEALSRILHPSLFPPIGGARG
jgi:iron complex transport system substrate-binding protein